MKPRTLLLTLALLIATAGLAQQYPAVRYQDAIRNVVKRSDPIYPPFARTARIQGRVVVAALIDETGKVAGTRVVFGHPMLTQAAAAALRQWKFKPFEVEGKASAVVVEFEAMFNGVTGVFREPSEPGAKK